MKKTILLLVSAISISTTFAQYNGGQQRGYGGNNGHDVVINTSNRDFGGGGFDRGTYFFSAKDRDMQLADINRSYDRKIQGVKNRFFMGRFQKERIISDLVAQRNSEISGVYAKFNDRHNLFLQQAKRYDDRRDDGRRNW